MATPDAIVTSDDSHGTIVSIPLAPTRHEQDRARRARHGVSIAHLLAATLLSIPAGIATSGSTRAAVLLAILAGCTTSAAFVVRHLPRCHPKPRWATYTARDLPGLDQLVGPYPDHLLSAMAETDPQRYNTNTLAAALNELTTYRDEWNQTLGSVLMADRLGSQAVAAWKPVRDTAIALELGLTKN